MKIITSTDNAQFKALLKLVQSSRERRLAGYSLLDGVHLIQAYQARFGAPEQLVLTRDGAENPEVRLLMRGQSESRLLCLQDHLFRQLSSMATLTGVMAVVKTPRSDELPATLKTCVMLEDIQDPGNMGSILRSCAAAGVQQVFLSRQTVNAWSPRVLRAGMGAHFSVDIYERADLVALARGFPGRVLVTQSRAGRSVFQCDLSGPVALVFGNEGAGVSQALLACAHDTISIPMHLATESLNVAAAAAICLFERVRQLQ